VAASAAQELNNFQSPLVPHERDVPLFDKRGIIII